jgi:plasmid replication initiation protein
MKDSNFLVNLGILSGFGEMIFLPSLQWIETQANVFNMQSKIIQWISTLNMMKMHPRLFFATVFEVADSENYVKQMIAKIVDEYVGSLTYRFQDFFQPPLSLSQLKSPSYAEELITMLEKYPTKERDITGGV